MKSLKKGQRSDVENLFWKMIVALNVKYKVIIIIIFFSCDLIMFPNFRAVCVSCSLIICSNFIIDCLLIFNIV